MQDIIKNFNVSRFLDSLQYMWKGMLSIFIVIGVIILFIVLLQKLTNRQPKKNDGAGDQ